MSVYVQPVYISVCSNMEMIQAPLRAPVSDASVSLCIERRLGTYVQYVCRSVGVMTYTISFPPTTPRLTHRVQWPRAAHYTMILERQHSALLGYIRRCSVRLAAREYILLLLMFFFVCLFVIKLIVILFTW